MPEKKKCLHTKYQFVQRRADQFTQLNPTEVYHAAPAFVNGGIQDE